MLDYVHLLVADLGCMLCWTGSAQLPDGGGKEADDSGVCGSENQNNEPRKRVNSSIKQRELHS